VNNLNQKNINLFQVSDRLLLPDESALEEISRKQRDLEPFGKEMVFQGFVTMRNFLQELANQTDASLFNFRDEANWTLEERSQTHPNSPSLWELTRHLSNWMTVFVSPIRKLDIRGDIELIRYLESTDHHISILAAIMLGHEEFSYLGVNLGNTVELGNDFASYSPLPRTNFPSQTSNSPKKPGPSTRNFLGPSIQRRHLVDPLLQRNYHAPNILLSKFPAGCAVFSGVTMLVASIYSCPFGLPKHFQPLRDWWHMVRINSANSINPVLDI